MIKKDGQDTWNSRGVAAICRVGRNSMLNYLREKQILRKIEGCILPYSSEYITQGWFRINHTGRFNKRSTYWTEKGLDETRIIIEEAKMLGKLKTKVERVPEDKIKISYDEFLDLD